MASFFYEALTSSGQSKTGSITAESDTDAYAKLKQANLTPVRLKEQVQDKADVPPQNLIKPNKALLANFLSGMSNLIASHVPLLDALEMVKDSEPNKKLKNILGELYKAVQAGQSLGSAMAQYPAFVPAHVIKLINAAETSGTLDSVLKDLSAQIDQEIAVRKRIQSGLTYPIILIFAAVLVLTILTTVLVPAVAPLFTGAGQPIPDALQFLIDLEYILTSHYIELVVTVLGVATVLKMLGLHPKFRRRIVMLFYQLPAIGPFALKLQLARMFRLVSVMQKNGVSLYNSLETAKDVFASPVLKDLLSDCLRELQDGGQLSPVLEREKKLPILVKRFVLIGERTGTLPDKLQKLSTVLHKTTSQQLELLLQLLPPALTLLIGIVVGSFIVVIMDAILSVNDLAL